MIFSITNLNSYHLETWYWYQWKETLKYFCVILFIFLLLGDDITEKLLQMKTDRHFVCVHRCGASDSMRACHGAGPGLIPGRDKFPGWGFFSPVRQMSGSFRPPRSPNIIWPSLSSILIHYGHQWSEMLMHPKTWNIHTYMHFVCWIFTYPILLSQYNAILDENLVLSNPVDPVSISGMLTSKRRDASVSESPPISSRPRWSHGYHTHLWIRGLWFNCDQGRRIFQSVKILSMTSFGREVKPWVPCCRFTAHKRTSSQN